MVVRLCERLDDGERKKFGILYRRYPCRLHRWLRLILVVVGCFCWVALVEIVVGFYDHRRRCYMVVWWAAADA